MKQTFFLLALLSCLLPQLLTAQSPDRNYVLTRTYTSSTGDSHIDEVRYYDGLGREEQTVLKAFTPGGKDVASGTDYDAYGRVWRSYLPVTTGKSDGSYYPELFTQTQRDSRPYSETLYEHSPLALTASEAGAGAAWHNAGRSVRTVRTVNTASGLYSARRFTLTADGGLTSPGLYAEGDLWVTLTIGEDNDSTLTFTDRRDRTVLTRALDRGTAHDTYSIYDDHNLLRYVLPPQAEGRTDVTTLSRYAYRYEYDHRNRRILSRMPGCEPVYQVYDKADRLALTQDGNQRTSNRWTVYKYDAIGRLLYTLEHTDNTSLATLRTQLSSMAVTESKGGADPLGIGYTCNTLPQGTDRKLLQVNYYDDHAFLDRLSVSERTALAYTVRSGYGTKAPYADGLLTGTRSYLTDGSGDYLATAVYYDTHARPVQTHTVYPDSKHTREWTAYTFTGKPQKRYIEHADGTTAAYTYSYDSMERLTALTCSLDDGTAVTLATYTYDDYGRLQGKSLHGSAANRLTYTYNIRDWLTSVSGNRFTQNLYYNTGSGTPQYGGNVSSMTWKAGNESVTRGYKFTYDALSRLTSATYGEGTSIASNANRFTEKITGYDLNGNITGLQRYGQTSSSAYGLVDNLTYTYTGNQVTRVDDAASASAYEGGFAFKDAVKQANEYTYDSNGNLTQDLNKNILSIKYNSLDLPSKIVFSDGSTITYVYAADGTKLRTVHVIVVTRTDYCGNVIYKNGVHKYLLTEEGYVTLSDNKYHYYLQDHQGNNREVVDQSGAVEEVNHYYPFGGVFASTSTAQPYKYNGKELDTNKGLNWYDYGARMYDVELGRFTTVDPSAESYYATGPYAYCGGNPVNRTDPTGTDWIQDRYGAYLWDDNATNQETTRQGWTYIGASLPEGTNRYSILEEINGNLYHKNTSNPWATLVNWISGKQLLVEKKVYDPVADHMMQQAVETGGELTTGIVAGKAFGVISKAFRSSSGKGFSTFEAFKKAYGPAGKGQAWHHIVERNPSNISKFGAEKIHNTNNLIRLPHGKGSIHAKISGYYSSKKPFSNGLTVRDWLKSQSFEQQYKFGIKTLKDLGWRP